MNIKALFLSKGKKKELEKELKHLVEIDRKEISGRLAEARELSRGENQDDLIMVIEEKQKLEDRIREIRDILARSKISKEECKITTGIGSEIILGYKKDVKIFKLVSPVEVDPSKNRISVESEIGKRLKGLKVGSKISLEGKDKKKVTYKVLYIC